MRGANHPAILPRTSTLHTKASFPKSGRESLLPLDAPAGEILRQNGILLAGISWLDSGQRAHGPGSHCHSALFSLAGLGQLVTESGSRDLSPGEVVVAPAHTPHTCSAREGPWHVIWFRLADNQAWDRINAVGLCVHRCQSAELLRHAMERFTCEAGSRQAEADRLAELHAAAIVAYLDRELLRGTAGQGHSMHSRLNRLRDRLNTHLARRWTVRDMARETMLSQTHLTRLCREIYGTTPSQMLGQLRMQRARELLGETSFKLAMIAGMLGYNDSFAFSAAFKRMCGTSPRYYRERTMTNPGVVPASPRTG